MYKWSDFSWVKGLFRKQVVKPAAPLAGEMAVYFKSDGKLYIEDENGIETEIGAALAGIVTSHKHKGFDFVPTELSVDHSWYGDVSTELVNEDGSLFDALYLNSLGYAKALATATATMPGVALRLTIGTGAQSILIRGYARDDSWAFTVGQLVYVDETTGGLITATKPVAVGSAVQPIGYAIASNIIYFNPNYIYTIN